VQKALIVDIEKCTGCRICEMACSFHHEKECNPAKSRIHVIKWEKAAVDVPMVCQQCDIPICESVCPVRAMFRDPETGAILIDYDACIGCRMCLVACPFGGPSINVETSQIIKCDLCKGKPRCAEMCPTGAIEYVPANRVTLMKKRASAEKLGELVRRLVVPE